MFSKFEIHFPISKQEVCELIEGDPVIQTLPFQLPLGEPQLKLEKSKEENTYKIRITRMFIFFPFFGKSKLISLSDNECKLSGWIIAGPVFLAFLTFAYSFMTFELIRLGIRDYGTDKFIGSILITSIPFLFFILIPLFVLRGWRKNLKKEIIKRIGTGE